MKFIHIKLMRTWPTMLLTLWGIVWRLLSVQNSVLVYSRSISNSKQLSTSSRSPIQFTEKLICCSVNNFPFCSCTVYIEEKWGTLKSNKLSLEKAPDWYYYEGLQWKVSLNTVSYCFSPTGVFFCLWKAERFEKEYRLRDWLLRFPSFHKRTQNKTETAQA